MGGGGQGKEEGREGGRLFACSLEAARRRRPPHMRLPCRPRATTVVVDHKHARTWHAVPSPPGFSHAHTRAAAPLRRRNDHHTELVAVQALRRSGIKHGWRDWQRRRGPQDVKPPAAYQGKPPANSIAGSQHHARARSRRTLHRKSVAPLASGNHAHKQHVSQHQGASTFAPWASRTPNKLLHAQPAHRAMSASTTDWACVAGALSSGKKRGETCVWAAPTAVLSWLPS